jgi:XTP/dITP diphosphohydrolase
VPRRVVLATGNEGKLREMRALLGPMGLEVVAQSQFGVSPPQENGATFLANALIKARHASRQTGLPVIADDSGLEVDALGGRPGVLSARYAGSAATDEQNNALLLDELAGVPPLARSARYRCVMVFVRDAEDPEPVAREGVWEGRIAAATHGGGGFGYDPLFCPAGSCRTVAQLDLAEKNRSSHRALALRALVAALDASPR